jgi:arabinogalactan endo-1,4-beta-galactosidase
VKTFCLLLALCLALPAHADIIWRGADISFLPQVEDGGGVFSVGGEAGDLFEILADHGVNLIRLRIWHTPTGGWCDLDHTLAMAQRAHDAGQQILLDFHYSDTWADPGQQTNPAAWAALPFATLLDSVRVRTRDVLLAMIAQDTPPAMVQIGNEITPGMLWDDGRVGGAFNTSVQWSQLAQLIGAGVDGVEDAFAPAPRPLIMIHSDRGGDNGGCRWFFGNLLALGVDFDIIGLSYYPWWHGAIEALESNLTDLATYFGKDLVVAETAYPWTLGWFDDTHNGVGLPEHLLPGYPDTPAGQLAYLESIFGIVAGLPDGRGRGVVYWAPEWIPSPGFGSSWENLALFDETGAALPGLSAFTPATSVPPAVAPGLQLQRMPTGESDGVLLSIAAAEPRHGVLQVFDTRGRLLADVWEGRLVPEAREIVWRSDRSASGTLLFRLTSGDDSVTTKVLHVR